MVLLLRTRRDRVGRVRRQLEVARDVDLHAVPLANGDRRQPVQEPVHHLHRGLRRRVGRAAGDDDGPIAVALRRGRQCRGTGRGR